MSKRYHININLDYTAKISITHNLITSRPQIQIWNHTTQLPYARRHILHLHRRKKKRNHNAPKSRQKTPHTSPKNKSNTPLEN